MVTPSSAPGVRFTTPPAWMLAVPPAPLPQALPAPSGPPAIAHPFTIDPILYDQLLSPSVPITIALLYATIVTYLNRVNAERKHQPWPISKSQAFKIFVLAHNVFLAVYSTWTAIGMINAVGLSWPGLNGPAGLTGVVDSFCKIHGVHGVGNAAIYNATTSAWSFTNRALHLAADSATPETTDIGRIWNEGLAFYGWIFYLSKFYEVIDTFVILAKGKKSSFLQTYHHAGAMLCMWAGIRYMSPPIWMFVTVNSSLHALMYSYYALTGMGVKVPRAFKKTLTTLQITQFVVGATYAFSHLFIEYQLPVSVPYVYHLGDVAISVSSDMSSALSVATATASAGLGSWLKKAAFRAAGREGLAENVVNELGQTFGIDAVHAAEDLKAREEIRYRDDLQWVHCLDTSGQAFAILLNCMYLAPLTWLFLRFFARAYSKRQARRRSSAVSDIARYARDSSFDAMKGVSRNIAATVDETDDMNESAGADDAVQGVGEVLQKDVETVVETSKRAASNAQEIFEKTKSAASEGKDSFEGWVNISPNKLEDQSEAKTETGADVRVEAQTQEAQAQGPQTDEVETQEVQTEEVQAEEPPTEEAQTEEGQTGEAQTEEPPAEEEQTQEAQTQEAQTQEAQTQEAQTQEAQTQEAQTEEPPTEEPPTEEPPTEEAKVEEPLMEEAKVEEPTTEEVKTEEPPTEKVQTGEA